MYDLIWRYADTTCSSIYIDIQDLMLNHAFGEKKVKEIYFS